MILRQHLSDLELTLGIHYRGVQSEGGAVDGGQYYVVKQPII